MIKISTVGQRFYNVICGSGRNLSGCYLIDPYQSTTLGFELINNKGGFAQHQSFNSIFQVNIRWKCDSLDSALGNSSNRRLEPLGKTYRIAR